MTSGGGMQGELGAVFVSVVPSLAGMSSHFAKGAEEGAEVFTKTFKDRLGNILPRAMEDTLLAGSRTIGPALTQSILGGGDIRATVRDWAQMLGTEMNTQLKALPSGSYLAGAAKEMTEAAKAASAERVRIVQNTHTQLESAEREHISRMTRLQLLGDGSRIPEDSAERIAAQRNLHTVLEAGLLEHQKRAAEINKQSALSDAAASFTGMTSAVLAGAAALNVYKNAAAAVVSPAVGQGAIADMIRQADGARLGAAYLKDFRNAAESEANKVDWIRVYGPKWEDQFKNLAERASGKFGDAAEGQFRGIALKLLGEFGGPFARLTPLLRSHAGQAGQAGAQAIIDEFDRVPGVVVPNLDKVVEGFGSKMAKVTEMASTAFKVVGIIGNVDIGIKNLENIVKFGEETVKQFAKVGKDGADTMMSFFTDAVHGKLPDAMSAFNVLEEGFEAIWIQPQRVFNLFIDNTVGHIPLIGAAFKSMAGTIEEAMNVVFPLFDQFKEMGGQFAETVLDIGNEYIDMARKIAESTIDSGQIEGLASSVRDIMASGAVVHFEDVADSIGRLNSNIKGLDVTQLKELTTTFAYAEELVGHIDETKFAGILEAFHVDPGDSNETLTMLTNIVRETGIGFNELTGEMTRSGPAMRDLGYDVKQTGQFFAEMTAKGEKGTRLIFGLNDVVKKVNDLVEKGIFKNVKEGWDTILGSAKKYIDLNQDDKALSLLNRYLPPSSATLMWEDLKNHVIDTSDAMKLLPGTDAELKESVEKTKDLGQAWDVLGQQISAALAPVGMALAEALTSAGDSVSEWLRENQGKVAHWGTEILEIFISVMSGTAKFMVDTLAFFGPFLDFLKDNFIQFAREVILLVQPIAEAMSALGFSDVKNGLNKMQEALGKGMTFSISDNLDAFQTKVDGIVEHSVPKLLSGLHNIDSQFQNTENVVKAFDEAGISGETVRGAKPFRNAAGTYGDAEHPSLQLLGTPQQVSAIQDRLGAQGIHPSLGANNTVSGIKFDTDEAKKAWLDWWAENIGKVPAPVNLEPQVEGKAIHDTGDLVPQGSVGVDLVPQTVPGTTPHRFGGGVGMAGGGSVGSDGWVRGSWVPGKDSVPTSVPVGSYVINREQAQKHQPTLDRLYPGGGRGGATSSGMMPVILEVGERVMPPGGPRGLYDAINYRRGYRTGGPTGFTLGGEAGDDPVRQLLYGFARGVGKAIGIDVPWLGKPKKELSVSGMLAPYGAPDRADTGGAYYSPGPTTVGGDVDSWVAQALQITGTPASWAPGLKVLIGRESSGNPKNINLKDSNAIAGHPSQGLMQLIPSNFSTYHVAGTSNSITDPVANIAAGIGYIKATYGGIGNVQQANPNLPPKGYATGGAVGDIACADGTCGSPYCGKCNGGPISAFGQGGDVGGVSQVIWSDLEDPTVRAAHGDAGVGIGYGKVWSGGPGSPYSNETNPGGQGYGGHHGHVHTTFNSNPFTGERYGIADQNTTLGDWSAFPSWVHQLGDMYGLDAKTYTGHQVWGGLNHGIDWYPRGKQDMSGQSYTHADNQTLNNFATSAMAVGTGQGSFGGGTDRWGNTGGNFSMAGDPWKLGGGSPKPPKVKDGHETPPGGYGAGSGTGLGIDQVPAGLSLPPEFTGADSPVNPYTNMPVGLNADAQKDYKQKFDEYLNRLKKSGDRVTEADVQAAKDDQRLSDAKREEAKALEDYNKLEPFEQKNEDNTIVKKYLDAKKRTAEAQEAADKAHARATQESTDAIIDSEGLPPKPPKDGSESGNEKYGSMGEELGGGIIKGAAQELGFGDVWKSLSGGSMKPPWEWGIWKLFAGGLSLGAGALNRRLENGGGIPGLGGAPGMGGSPGDNVGQDSAPGPGGNGGPDITPGPLGGVTPTTGPLAGVTPGAGMGSWFPNWKPKTAIPGTAPGEPFLGTPKYDPNTNGFVDPATGRKLDTIQSGPNAGKWVYRAGSSLGPWNIGPTGSIPGAQPAAPPPFHQPNYDTLPKKKPISPSRGPGLYGGLSGLDRVPDYRGGMPQPQPDAAAGLGPAHVPIGAPGSPWYGIMPPPDGSAYPTRVGGGGLDGYSGGGGQGFGYGVPGGSDALFGVGLGGGLAGKGGQLGSALGKWTAERYLHPNQDVVSSMRSPSDSKPDPRSGGGTLTIHNVYQGLNSTPATDDKLRSVVLNHGSSAVATLGHPITTLVQ